MKTIYILGLLIICCLFSSVVKSNQCLPKEGCDKIIQLVSNSDVTDYIDSLSDEKREIIQDVFLDHCVFEECKTDICSKLMEYMDDFNRAPQSVQNAFNQIKGYFVEYCSLKLNIGVGIGLSL